MLALASTIPAILLGIVLIVSGIAKARDSKSVTESFITLQLPPWLTRSIAPALLPWGELVLAVALAVLGGWLGGVAAAAAVLLFAAYLWVIVRAVGFDHPVECGCLGRLGLGTVGPVTIVRNVLLLALAIWALADLLVTGRSVLSRWLSAGTEGWAWLAAVAVALVIGGLMVYAGQPRTAGAAAGAAEPGPGLPAHASASRPAVEEPSGSDEDELLDYERSLIPYLPLRTPDDTVVSLRDLALHQARLMVWVNPGCGSCLAVLDAIPDLRTRASQIGIHLMFADVASAQNPYVTEEMLGEQWFIDKDYLVAVSMQMGSPSAVLLGGDGYLAGGPVSGREAVLAFFDDIAEALAEAAAEPEAITQTPEPEAITNS